MSYIQDYVHETNSGIVSFAIPGRMNSRILDELGDKDQTYGGHADLRFPPLPVQDLITTCLDELWQLSKMIRLLMSVEGFYRLLPNQFCFFQTQGFDLGHLPNLLAFDVEDGSILIEWIFDDFRVGFGIEPTLSESSWYLVSNIRLGDINLAGEMPKNELETQDLMLHLVNFVVSNS